MPFSYQTWPFRPFEARSAEENACWWAECHVAAPLQVVLSSEPHWRVISGGAGSGKTTALLALEQAEAQTSLAVPYPPDRWPSGPRAWVPHGNHLAQIMAAVSVAAREALARRSAQAAELTTLQKGFVRWLIEKYGGARAFQRWAEGLEPALAGQFQATVYEDLYPTTTLPLDVHGQIDELAGVVGRLGYRRVLVLSDLNADSARAYRADLMALFGWLDMMHHPGLSVAAALPDDADLLADLKRNARGRVSFTFLSWDSEQIQPIVTRHLGAALQRPVAPLTGVAADDLWKRLEQLLIAEYGRPVPAAWVGMLEVILERLSRQPEAPRPLSMKHFEEIGHLFFARFVPLRLEPGVQGVWRGPRFINLTERVFEFVEILHRHSGQPVSSSDRELIALAGSKGNIHSLAARARRALEPFPEAPVYLFNSRIDGGYWLEHST